MTHPVSRSPARLRRELSDRWPSHFGRSGNAIGALAIEPGSPLSHHRTVYFDCQKRNAFLPIGRACSPEEAALQPPKA